MNELESLAIYKENFRQYPDIYEIIRILNKEKAIQLPYSINYASMLGVRSLLKKKYFKIAVRKKWFVIK